MTDTGFGIWAGTAINDTSSVVAAGFAFSDAAGELATIVKLTRTLMIIPITLALTLHRTWKRKPQGTAAASNYSIVKIFPWFVLGFLLTAIVNSTGWIPAAASELAQRAGQVWHYGRHGGHRIKHKSEKSGEEWRAPHYAGTLLLVRRGSGIPGGTAAAASGLVVSNLRDRFGHTQSP